MMDKEASVPKANGAHRNGQSNGGAMDIDDDSL